MMVRFFIYLSLFLAGVLGITLSVSLQAPAVIAMGVAGVMGGLLYFLPEGRRQKSKGQRGEERQAEVVSHDGEGSSRNTLSTINYPAILAILATCYFVVRALMSPVFDLGLQDLMLILPAACLYFVAGYVVTGKSSIKLRQGLAWSVLVLLLLHLTSSVMQLRGGDGFSLARYFESGVRSSDGHISGMYGYYGSFANFAVMAGMLCLSLGVWGRMRVLLRRGLLLLGLIALSAAVYSQSRTAVLSLVVSLAVFGGLLAVSFAGLKEKVRRRWRTGILVIGVLGIILSVIGGVWAFKERARAVDQGLEDAGMVNMVFDSGVRAQFWSMAAEQWVDNPVVGAGSRSYSYECFRYWSPNLTTGQANPEFAHNEYLQLMADYGVIGLFFVLGLLVVHGYVGTKQILALSNKVGENGLKQGSNAMALAIAGVCGMMVMAVHSVSDFRAHLLPNLLVFVCCFVWVLPVRGLKERMDGRGAKVGGGRVGWLRWVVGGALLILSFVTIALGAYQLWGGMPLLKHQIAKEDDAWIPEKIDRRVWIPALEESVSRVPTDVRWMRLGALYSLESNSNERQKSNEVRKQAREKSIAAYEKSIERNSFNPIPKIDLAQIYEQLGDFARADTMYASASEMARARERWFRMHSEWGKMHQRWAVKYWVEKHPQKAEEHFLRAIKLLKESYDYAYFYQNAQWVKEYTSVLISYARFLDTQKRFAEADALFAEGRKQVNWVNMQKYTALGFYEAQHLYDQGYATWMKRKPEEALKLMLKAQKRLMIYRSIMKGKVAPQWQQEMDKIQKVIDFLKQGGVRVS